MNARKIAVNHYNFLQIYFSQICMQIGTPTYRRQEIDKIWQL